MFIAHNIPLRCQLKSEYRLFKVAQPVLMYGYQSPLPSSNCLSRLRVAGYRAVEQSRKSKNGDTVGRGIELGSGPLPFGACRGCLHISFLSLSATVVSATALTLMASQTPNCIRDQLVALHEVAFAPESP